MKRAFDFCLALVGLVVIAPILIVAAVAVLLVDGWPVLFIQERVGKDGRPFRMYKFRTMLKSRGLDLTVGADARITKLGALLRKTKIDELPQLINVLFGQMSFVGPRPEISRYVSIYTPEQRKVLSLKPGITDPASLKYIDESELLATAADPHKFYVETVMPDKIRLNLEYAERATLASDIGLICETVMRAAGRKNSKLPNG